MDNYNPSTEITLKNLRKWNILAGSLHMLQSIGALTLALSDSTFSSFTPPLITTFANWNETMGAKTEIQVRGHVPFAYVTCAVPLMSAVAHFIVASRWGWPRYVENLRLSYANPWRWFEYAWSSSLMIVLVAILFAIYDISLLLTLFTINMTVMYTGRAMDRANSRLMSTEGSSTGKARTVDWEPFIAGSILAAVEWAIIYMTLAQFDFSKAPAYIIPLLFTYFVLFCSFAVVDGWLYWGAGAGGAVKTGLERVLIAERGFMILSLCAKSLLLWLIFFGTRQPHE